MKIISHRGNMFGPNLDLENNPQQINKITEEDIDVEIDLWYCDSKLFLGHNNPTYEINNEWILEKKDKLWIHLKNIECIEYASDTDLNYFWHENDKFTLTSKGIPWCYPEVYIKNGITVMLTHQTKRLPSNVLGICTDYVKDYL